MAKAGAFDQAEINANATEIAAQLETFKSGNATRLFP
jgi:hypothetical protein